MASANIYFLRDRILVHPNKRTTDGVEIGSPPYVCLELGSKAAELGEAIRSALKTSYEVMPHPTDWKPIAAQRLDAGGVKTEKAFMATASLIQVRVEAVGYYVEPYINGGSVGPGKGFTPVAGLGTLLPSDVDVERLGAQVLTSVVKCRGAT